MSAAERVRLTPLLAPLFEQRPEVEVLDNGLTVVSQELGDHPLFSAQVWVRTGSIHEGLHCGSGLSHFLEHMVFKGSGGFGPGEIPERVQAFGGQINAYTAFDRTVYYIDGPHEKLGEALELLYALTLGANLAEDEWRRERDVILREIDMNLDDPDRQTMRALFATAYREHPFRHPVIGHRSLFEQVSCDLLQRYWERRYQPDNMVLSVVGRFDAEALRESVKRTFGEAPRRFLEPVAITAEPPQLACREMRQYGDSEIVRGLVGYKIPSMRHGDAVALDLLAAILGSGHSSRLRQRIREEANLVHQISATTWNPGEPGLLWLNYQCDPERAAAAEEAILSCCEQFATEELDPADLDKAKQFAGISEIQCRQTVSSYASRLGLVTAMVREPGYPQRYFAIMDDLSVDDIRDVARRYLRPENRSSVAMLPESKRGKRKSGRAAVAQEQFQEIRLPNGGRLFWQRDCSLPRLHIRLSSLAGPAYEPAERTGLSSLLSTLLTKDTEARSAAEIAALLERGGGFFHEASGNHSLSLNLDLAPHQALTGLLLLSEALACPAFRESTFQRERAAQLAGLREQMDDIAQVGRIGLRRHFFGPHPFASDPEGREDSVAAIEREDLLGLHEQLSCPANLVLVITGDFDPDQLLGPATDWLGALPARDFVPRRPPFRPPGREQRIIDHMQREQAVVFAGYPDPGFATDGDLTAQILDEVLSDMAGPLFRSVREDNGLAYFVGASRMTSYDFGCFYLYAGTHPSHVETIWRLFDQEVDKICESGLSSAQLEAARTRLIVHNRFSLQSRAARAGRVALNALYDKPIMDWLDYEERLLRIRPQDVRHLARAIFHGGSCLRYAITPEEA